MIRKRRKFPQKRQPAIPLPNLNNDRPGKNGSGGNGKSILSHREILVVQEYLVDFDIMGAVVRAGLARFRSTKKSRQEIADEIFARPEVQVYVNEVIGHRVERTKITQDKVLSELAQIAFQDPIDIYDDSGNLKALQDMPASARRAISEITYKQLFARKEKGQEKQQIGYIAHIKMHDKLSTLRTLLAHTTPGATLPSESVNYNFNQYNIINNNGANITLDDFSKEELSVLKKMIGNEEPEEVLELQKVEDQHVCNDATVD